MVSRDNRAVTADRTAPTTPPVTEPPAPVTSAPATTLPPTPTEETIVPVPRPTKTRAVTAATQITAKPSASSSRMPKTGDPTTDMWEFGVLAAGCAGIAIVAGKRVFAGR